MLFNLFKRKNKNSALSEAETQWNKMWDSWVEGKIASPFKELMTYQSEVNNGGHLQYFDNTQNISNLKEEMLSLNEILPDIFKKNLAVAYNAYVLFEQDELNEEAEATMEKCDNIFFENEKEINDILEAFCKTL